MGINYGGRIFSEPVRLRDLFLPLPMAGLYAVLVPDDSWSPRPFRAIYFGQSANLSERIDQGHHKYDAWVRQARSAEELYIALSFMPGLTAEQRRAVESDLIRKYQPVCNEVTAGGTLASLVFGWDR